MAKKSKNSKTSKIIQELAVAYHMELETVHNYVAHSTNLDGIPAEEIKKSLATDIQEELGHATTLAKRIKILGGLVPTSMQFKPTQKDLQLVEDTTDILPIIKGVISAEEKAIAQYNKIIKMCEGTDYATQDVAIQLLGVEETHKVEFEGFLKEYERFCKISSK